MFFGTKDSGLFVVRTFVQFFVCFLFQNNFRVGLGKDRTEDGMDQEREDAGGDTEERAPWMAMSV